MNFLKKLSLAITLISMSGCSWYSNHSFIQARHNEYLTAKNIAPLRIPPGLSSSTMRTEYPVSNRTYPCPTTVDLTPPGLNR